MDNGTVILAYIAERLAKWPAHASPAVRLLLSPTAIAAVKDARDDDGHRIFGDEEVREVSFLYGYPVRRGNDGAEIYPFGVVFETERDVAGAWAEEEGDAGEARKRARRLAGLPDPRPPTPPPPPAEEMLSGRSS